MNQFGCVRRLLAIVVTLSCLGANAAEVAQNTQRDENDDGRTWQEEKVEYPSPPEKTNLIAIDLGPTQTRRYWVDKSSLSVGQDGVVRYTLVVESQGGVRGATYEGMRCETRELRRYAVLKTQTEWSRSRNETWSRITESPGHRQHAVLYLYHFCPDGIAVNNAQSALRNLERGGRFPGESPVAY